MPHRSRFMMLAALAWFLTFGIPEARSSNRDLGPVMPLVLRHDRPPQAASMQKRVYRIMQEQARYLLTLVRPWENDANYALVTQSISGEHGIRPNTGMIEGLAFLYRFGPYDDKLVGRSREEILREVIVPMMGYCVATHCTGDRATSDGKPWGDAWQSAHWAQMLGMAAWWLWDDLPDDLRAGVRRIVAHEADRIARAKPPHQLRRDTKAEENAWNSQILAIAPLLMPDDPRRPGWELAFQKWVLSSHLRPTDKHSTTLVDGRTVAEQFTGANVFDDYTVENHEFVHPDYMTAYSLTVGCSLHYALTNREMPEALLYNIPGIYENLKWFSLPDGGFVYPNGQDWELFRNPIWSYKHLLMAVYFADPDAWALANDSLNTMERMQRRHASGMIYGLDETFFPSSRTDLFHYLGRTWLALQQAKAIADDPKPRFGVRRLESAKIILHRTPKTVNTFSWGAKIMAMCVPLRLDRVVSPDQRSGIGHIRVAGKAKPLPVRLETVDVRESEDSFTANAVVMHGDGLIRAEIRVESRPGGTLCIDERLVAAKDVTTTEIATGLIGVLNNRDWVYERGERRLAFDDEEIVFPALSGKTYQREGVETVLIDSAIRVRGKQPLTIRYLGADAVERGRATDLLHLNFIDGEHAWSEGQVISEYGVRISRVAE